MFSSRQGCPPGGPRGLLCARRLRSGTGCGVPCLHSRHPAGRTVARRPPVASQEGTQPPHQKTRRFISSWFSLRPFVFTVTEAFGRGNLRVGSAAGLRWFSVTTGETHVSVAREKSPSIGVPPSGASVFHRPFVRGAGHVLDMTPRVRFHSSF